MWGDWAAWVVFVVVVLILPWLYGWGWRGWGPPYPAYYQRLVHDRRNAIAPKSAQTDECRQTVPPVRGLPPAREARTARDRGPAEGWSWLADLMWLGVVATIGWAIILWTT